MKNSGLKKRKRNRRYPNSNKILREGGGGGGGGGGKGCRSRSNEEEEDVADRVSILPDLVLNHIISFLPPADLPNTRILSKSWLRFWIRSPNLSLSSPALRAPISHMTADIPKALSNDPEYTTNYVGEPQDIDDVIDYFELCMEANTKFVAFVDKILCARANSSNTTLCSLRISAPCLGIQSNTLESWWRTHHAASFRGIHHLDLLFHNCVGPDLRATTLPDSFLDALFCGGAPCLQTLKLDFGVNCLLDLPSSSSKGCSMPNLRALHLRHFLLPDRSLSCLLSSPTACPVLHELSLDTCFGSQSDGGFLRISSPKIVRLDVKVGRHHKTENVTS